MPVCVSGDQSPPDDCAKVKAPPSLARAAGDADRAVRDAPDHVRGEVPADRPGQPPGARRRSGHLERDRRRGRRRVGREARRREARGERVRARLKRAERERRDAGRRVGGGRPENGRTVPELDRSGGRGAHRRLERHGGARLDARGAGGDDERRRGRSRRSNRRVDEDRLLVRRVRGAACGVGVHAVVPAGQRPAGRLGHRDRRLEGAVRVQQRHLPGDRRLVHRGDLIEGRLRERPLLRAGLAGRARLAGRGLPIGREAAEHDVRTTGHALRDRRTTRVRVRIRERVVVGALHDELVPEVHGRACCRGDPVGEEHLDRGSALRREQDGLLLRRVRGAACGVGVHAVVPAGQWPAGRLGHRDRRLEGAVRVQQRHLHGDRRLVHRGDLIEGRLRERPLLRAGLAGRARLAGRGLPIGREAAEHDVRTTGHALRNRRTTRVRVRIRERVVPAALDDERVAEVHGLGRERSRPVGEEHRERRDEVGVGVRGVRVRRRRLGRRWRGGVVRGGGRRGAGLLRGRSRVRGGSRVGLRRSFRRRLRVRLGSGRLPRRALVGRQFVGVRRGDRESAERDGQGREDRDSDTGRGVVVLAHARGLRVRASHRSGRRSSLASPILESD